MKISKRGISQNICLLVLLLYALSRGSWGNLIHRYWIPMILLCAGYFALQYLARPRMNGFVLQSFLLVCVVLLFNNYSIMHGGSLLYEYTFLAIILFSISMSRKADWISISIRVMELMSWFYGFMTLLCFFSRSFFDRFVYPFITSINVPDFMNLSSYYTVGFTYHYSTNGMYVALAVCMACGVLVTEKNNWNRSVFDLKRYSRVGRLSFLALMFLALLLTNKRAHILFTFAGAIVAYYLYNSNKPMRRIAKVFGLLMSLLILGYILNAIMPDAFGFLQRFTETTNNGDVSSNRFWLWGLAYQMMEGHLLVGNGWGSFVARYGYHTHNIFVELLTETGIIGSVIYISYMLIGYIKTARALILSRRNICKLDYNDEKYLVIAIAYQTFFILYGFTGTCLYEPPTFIPYILFCTMGQYYWNIGREQGNRK